VIVVLALHKMQEFTCSDQIENKLL